MSAPEDAKTGTAAYSIDDIIGDAYSLRHQLDVTFDILREMDYGLGDGRNRDLDKVSALVTIGLNDLSRIIASVEANYAALNKGRSA
jgi:hypothetical protein